MTLTLISPHECIQSCTELHNVPSTSHDIAAIALSPQLPRQ